MTFKNTFEKIKDKIEEYDYTPGGDFAIQIELKNKDSGGIFYIQEKDRNLYIEPYTYHDNDASVSLLSGDLSRLIEGKLSSETALRSDKITIAGNGEAFRRFLSSLSKKEEKKMAGRGR